MNLEAVVRIDWKEDRYGPDYRQVYGDRDWADVPVHARSARKGRLSVDLIMTEMPEPSGPECTDGACEGWQCKSAHGWSLMKFLVPAVPDEEWMRLLGSSNPEWRPTAEVDHKVWKAYRAEALAAKRVAVAEAIEKGLLPDVGKFAWSDKAGCGCGCSPGFVVDAPELRGTWSTVKEVAS